MIAGMPTPRQLEAFHLRCEGLTYEEIAKRMGIAEPTANGLARAAAIKLCRHPPRPTMVNNAVLARKHFPAIAKRWPLKETETA
jgi:DNA-binding NarL/FixJ family response regulator